MLSSNSSLSMSNCWNHPRDKHWPTMSSSSGKEVSCHSLMELMEGSYLEQSVEWEKLLEVQWCASNTNSRHIRHKAFVSQFFILCKIFQLLEIIGDVKSCSYYLLTFSFKCFFYDILFCLSVKTVLNSWLMTYLITFFSCTSTLKYHGLLKISEYMYFTMTQRVTQQI